VEGRTQRNVFKFYFMNMRTTILIFGLIFLAIPCPTTAQGIDPATPPPPPPEAPAAAPEPAEPATPAFDPYHAEKSVEIGTFYLKRGNYDAAIDRFEDATRQQPGLAKPWRLLGEAYEKKHMNAKSVECYKKYLEIFPGAEDANKVKNRISALEEKSGQQASKNPAH
jgi:tetratricopeptide (TPR) repeat protein